MGRTFYILRIIMAEVNYLGNTMTITTTIKIK